MLTKTNDNWRFMVLIFAAVLAAFALTVMSVIDAEPTGNDVGILTPYPVYGDEQEPCMYVTHCHIEYDEDGNPTSSDPDDEIPLYGNKYSANWGTDLIAGTYYTKTYRTGNLFGWGNGYFDDVHTMTQSEVNALKAIHLHDNLYQSLKSPNNVTVDTTTAAKVDNQCEVTMKFKPTDPGLFEFTIYVKAKPSSTDTSYSEDYFVFNGTAVPPFEEYEGTMFKGVSTAIYLGTTSANTSSYYGIEPMPDGDTYADFGLSLKTIKNTSNFYDVYLYGSASKTGTFAFTAWVKVSDQRYNSSWLVEVVDGAKLTLENTTNPTSTTNVLSYYGGTDSTTPSENGGVTVFDGNSFVKNQLAFPTNTVVSLNQFTPTFQDTTYTFKGWAKQSSNAVISSHTLSTDTVLHPIFSKPIIVTNININTVMNGTIDEIVSISFPDPSETLASHLNHLTVSFTDTQQPFGGNILSFEKRSNGIHLVGTLVNILPQQGGYIFNAKVSDPDFDDGTFVVKITIAVSYIEPVNAETSKETPYYKTLTTYPPSAKISGVKVYEGDSTVQVASSVFTAPTATKSGAMSTQQITFHQTGLYTVSLTLSATGYTNGTYTFKINVTDQGPTGTPSLDGIEKAKSSQSDGWYYLYAKNPANAAYITWSFTNGMASMRGQSVLVQFTSNAECTVTCTVSNIQGDSVQKSITFRPVVETTKEFAYINDTYSYYVTGVTSTSTLVTSPQASWLVGEVKESGTEMWIHGQPTTSNATVGQVITVKVMNGSTVAQTYDITVCKAINDLTDDNTSFTKVQNGYDVTLTNQNPQTGTQLRVNWGDGQGVQVVRNSTTAQHHYNTASPAQGYTITVSVYVANNETSPFTFTNVMVPTSGANHTVIFHANNGTTDTQSRSYTSDSFNLPICSFTYEGHSFKGWGLSTDATTTYGVGSVFTLTNTTTDLYAIWQEGSEQSTSDMTLPIVAAILVTLIAILLIMRLIL